MEVAGTQLAREYYEEVVGPLVMNRWPGLPHAGGRLGSGSDVLGFDDGMSRDHDWGLRLTLLVAREHVARVDAYLDLALPESFRGYPTRFTTSWDPATRHRVQVDTVQGFCEARLGVAVDGSWSVLDWLSLTGQCLLEVTGGAVFSDSVGTITAIRRRLAWYPRDVWQYVVAADWSRIGEELPLMARAGVVGDDTGSRVLAGRLVHTAMHLGFLLERRWAPYPKWLGSAFAALPRAGSALGMLHVAVAGDSWQARQDAFCQALAVLNDIQQSVGLPVASPVTQPFFDRPFQGIHPGAVRSLLSSIQDPQVRRLPAGVGSIEQWSDNVDVLATPSLRVAAVKNTLAPPLEPRPRL